VHKIYFTYELKNNYLLKTKLNYNYKK